MGQVLSIDHAFLSVGQILGVFYSCLIILINFEFVFVVMVVLDLRVTLISMYIFAVYCKSISYMCIHM